MWGSYKKRLCDLDENNNYHLCRSCVIKGDRKFVKKYQKIKKEQTKVKKIIIMGNQEIEKQLKKLGIQILDKNVVKKQYLNNGVTLCKECHIKFHKMYGSIKFPSILETNFLIINN